jgi:hypothetical protein
VAATFGLKEMLQDNPHNIPENVLADWLIVRNAKRAKITRTAWKQVIGNVIQLQDKGLTPLFCFTTAVARGWVGLELRFFDEYLSGSKYVSKFISKEEHAANEQKIREREMKAQHEKEQEREAAKGFNDNILKKMTQRPDLSALRVTQEAERIELGMTKMEYHKHILMRIPNSLHSDEIPGIIVTTQDIQSKPTGSILSST